MAKNKTQSIRTTQTSTNVGCGQRLLRYTLFLILTCVLVAGLLIYSATSNDESSKLPTHAVVAENLGLPNDNITNIATETVTASLNIQPTLTRTTVSPSATITNTVNPTNTITNTPIPPATSTAIPQSYYAHEDANVRLCPDTTRNECSVVLQLHSGDAIDIVGINIQGSSFRGSKIWYQASYKGQTVYIHSALVSTTRPTVQAASSNSHISNRSDSNSSNQSNPPLSPFTCNCSKSCEAISLCQEAYYQLNSCSCSQLDDDNDGVPCENICSGG